MVASSPTGSAHGIVASPPPGFAPGIVASSPAGNSRERFLPPSAPLDPLTGIEAARFGVYVHFPFCLSKCPYCDFASVVARQIPQERYAEAIVRELTFRLREWPWLSSRTVDTVFFGGGTPSLWAPAFIENVLSELSRVFPFNPRAEITLEANPGAADAERFRGYRAAGINRLSMGVQSFQKETLAFLGRAHSGDEAVRAFEAARTAGFRNVSLDFIYAVPGQTVEQALADAEKACALSSEHLSAYALTLDRESLAEEVPLAKQLARGEVHLPPDETACAMNEIVRERYAAAGLHRYEVSNYARDGFHSRHNTLYWTGGEYLALGTGATGYAIPPVGAALRYANHRSWERYLNAVETGVDIDTQREPLVAEERFAERLAMGLRLRSGVDLVGVCRAFGMDEAPRLVLAEQLVAGALATWHNGRLRLTPRGFDVHSAIAAKMM